MMAKYIADTTLYDALVEAGLIDDTKNIRRVLIDIQPGRIPMVYVEKFSHPHVLAKLVADQFGPDNLVPPLTEDSEKEG